MEFNSQVWARDRDGAWSTALVLHRHTDEERERVVVTVRFDSSGKEQQFTLTLAQAEEGEGTADIKLRNVKGQASVEEGAGVDDITALTHLHPPSILYTLHERYKQDIIYTYTGPILLAINPFWRVPLYSNKILEQYRRDGQARSYDPDHVSDLPPHAYATADAAYRLMMDPASERQQRNQSILVSGESGAGKTETTKIIMRYLAILGGHDSKALLDGDASVVGIEQQVLQSNPILEAFGNARTVRNDNSSRFGKFIEIDFDREGYLVGAAIRTFLLEKIRLVHTSEQERNFHVFYQMLAGAGPDALARWRLGGDPRVYHYMNQSGCYVRRDGVRDADLWAELQQAMAVMGISEVEREHIFSCVAGVLNAGNMEFTDTHDPAKGDELCGGLAPEGGAAEAAAAAAALWHVEEGALTRAVTSRAIKAGSEWLTVHHSAAKCRHARDALCKAVYAGLFDWLVAKINATIDRQRVLPAGGGGGGGTAAGGSAGGDAAAGGTAAASSGLFDWAGNSPTHGGGGADATAAAAEAFAANGGGGSFVGLLDIFGFEQFERNYFEQFLINYANERLQQQFNHFVFEMEQEEYRAEGIRWDFVEFPDNKDSIELIEGRPAGILSLLDEQCIVPRATDATLAGNLYKHLASHARFGAAQSLRVDHRFSVNHYAGDITYETEGFLEKNRDTLHQEGADLIASSASAFVAALGAGVRSEGRDGGSGAGGSGSGSSFGRRHSRAGSDSSSASAAVSGSSAHRRRPSALSASSVGAQFKSQLTSLLAVIGSTHPHYIRCLKPNDRNVRACFDVPRITAQLANGGVLAAVHVARAGFAVRMQHAEFIDRYSIMALPLVQKAWADARRASRVQSEQEAEVCRELLLDCVPLLSGVVTVASLRAAQAAKGRRGGGAGAGLERVRLDKGVSFRDVCGAAGVQMGTTKVFLRQIAFNRAEKARTLFLAESCVRIQTAYRMHARRRAYLIARSVVLILQSRLRGRLARRWYQSELALRAATHMQTWYRGLVARRAYVAQRAAALTVQTAARRQQARSAYVVKRRRTVALQCRWRQKLARQELLLRRREAAQVESLQAQIMAFERRFKEREEEMKRQQDEAIARALADATHAKAKAAAAAPAADADAPPVRAPIFSTTIPSAAAAAVAAGESSAAAAAPAAAACTSDGGGDAAAVAAQQRMCTVEAHTNGHPPPQLSHGDAASIAVYTASTAAAAMAPVATIPAGPSFTSTKASSSSATAAALADAAPAHAGSEEIAQLRAEAAADAARMRHEMEEETHRLRQQALAEATAIRAQAAADAQRLRAAAAAELARERAAADALRAQLAEQETARIKLAEEHAAAVRDAARAEAARLSSLHMDSLRAETQRLQDTRADIQRSQATRAQVTQLEAQRLAAARALQAEAEAAAAAAAAMASGGAAGVGGGGSGGATTPVSVRADLGAMRSVSSRTSTPHITTPKLQRRAFTGALGGGGGGHGGGGGVLRTTPRRLTGTTVDGDDHRDHMFGRGDGSGSVYGASSDGHVGSPRSSAAAAAAQHEHLYEDGLLDAEDLSMLSVGIDKAWVAQQRHSPTATYIAYRICVKTSRRGWEVERSYGDFAALHKVLAKAVGDGDELPPLPARKGFGESVTVDFIQDRKMCLQNYLAGLMADKGHWLAERNVDRVEVGANFNKSMMCELQAKQAFIGFLDPAQPSLQRDDEATLSASLSSIFSRFSL